MTTLTITPNWKNKTAKFKGTIAAGEHVAVRIENDDGTGSPFIPATALENLRLRVVDERGKTLAQFPMPDEVLPTVAIDDSSDSSDSGDSTADAWDSDPTPLACELNLNTVQMLLAVPPHATRQFLFVLDDYEAKTLYFKDTCEVAHWPRRYGEEEPSPANLDDYQDIIEGFREDIYNETDGFKKRVEDAEVAAIAAAARADAAEASANGANTGAWSAANAAAASASSASGSATDAAGSATEAKGYRNTAEQYKTAAAGSAANAATSAAAAEAWATGGTSGTPSATNNAKYYAEQAEATLEDKADKVEDATEGNFAGLDEDGNLTDSGKKASDFATAASVTSLSSTVSGLSSSKADKATTLAGYGITDGYTKLQTDGKIADAISAVKDSAPEAFDTLKEIADWIQDDQSGAAAMAAAIANKVDKVPGKGLSTEDYTATEKTKLSGVESGAKDNVVEAASASAFPQAGVAGKIYVAKDENKTYRWNGTQYVEIGGGSGGSSVTIDPTLSVQGAAADAKATGDALAGKRGKDDLALYKKVGVGDTWTLVGQDGTSTIATGVFNGNGEYWNFYVDGVVVAATSEGHTAGDFEIEWMGGPEVGSAGTATRPFTYQPVTGDALAKTSQLSGKADASAIRYDLGEAFVPDINDVFTDNTTNPPTDYVAMALLDRTMNCVQLTLGGIEELRLTFPAAVSGKVRDFGLRVEVGDGINALTAPALVTLAGVTLENADGAIPALADGAADAKGVTLLYFSETAPGVFLVKGEQVEEVS